MSIQTQQPAASELVTWNKARSIAADLLNMFYQNQGTYSSVQAAHPDFDFPPKPKVVQALMAVPSGRRFRQHDDLSRTVQGWA